MACKEENRVVSDENVHEVQIQTIITVTNNGSGIVNLDRFRNWSGKPYGGAFPTSVPPHGEVKFTHLADTPYGSVGAVQFSGVSKSGKRPARILAWDAPADYSSSDNPNKVTTYSGYKTGVDNMPWDLVLLKLEKSSSTDDYATIVHQAKNTAVVSFTINFDAWDSATTTEA